MQRSIIIFCLCISLFACKDNSIILPKSAGVIEIYDKEMLQVIDSNAIIEILADGFSWSEGPLWLLEQKKLIFTDVPQNSIYSWDEVNGKQIYLKPSGHTNINENGGKDGANGLIIDNKGQLILCQHGNRAVARMIAPLDAPKDSFEFLAHKYLDKKLNSPNDLYICKNGDILFTDPPYGLPDLDQDINKELKFNGIYLLRPDGTIHLIDSMLTKPNGIVLTSDEKTMYVSNSDEQNAIWIKYKLDSDKKIIERTLFADVTPLISSQKGLPDGMKINKKGYLFATGPGGVLIFNQDSRHLGTINTGQATSNCALDTDEKYLYMTAHSFLMRVKLKQ